MSTTTATKMRRTQTNRARAWLMAALVSLSATATAPAATASAAASVTDSQPVESCSPEDRAKALRAEQTAVEELLGKNTELDLTELMNEADVVALAAKGYDFYPHRQTSLRGMGWTVFAPFERQNPPRAGHPNLLFYEPSGEDVAEPEGFDFPYRLAGWAYVPLTYDPSQHPVIAEDNPTEASALGKCLTRDDWFVHERMIHPFDTGGIDNRPPEEKAHGSSTGTLTAPEPVTDCNPTGFISTNGDLCHARSWDIHLWRDNDGVAQVSVLNPSHKISGIDPQLGKAFFESGPTP